MLFVYQLNRKFQTLSQDEALIQIYFTQKINKYYETDNFDKVLSYVR